MLNLLTTLCLVEAFLVLTLLGELGKWVAERKDNKERRDASRRLYREHIWREMEKL